MSVLREAFSIPLFYVCLAIIIGVGIMAFREWRKMKKWGK